MRASSLPLLFSVLAVIALAGCVQTPSEGAPATPTLPAGLVVTATPTFSFAFVTPSAGGEASPAANATPSPSAVPTAAVNSNATPVLNASVNATANATVSPTAAPTGSPSANCPQELANAGYPIFLAENVTEEQCGAMVGEAKFTMNACYTTCLVGGFLWHPTYTCCGAQENTAFNRTACTDCGNTSTCPQPYAPDYACAYPPS